MSVAKRITESMLAYNRGDFESAVLPLCAAIAATARNEHPAARDHEAFKSFVHDYLEIATRFATGGRAIMNLNVQFEHPDLKPNEDGLCSIQQVMYHVIRCGIVHEASYSRIEFVDRGRFAIHEDGKLQLPSKLLIGFALAVVSSPSNADEEIPQEALFTFGKHQVPVRDLRGNKQKLLDMLKNP